MIKLFINLDSSTITKSDLSIFARNPEISQISESIMTININPIEFLHASLLLGLHPERFTYDISSYINNVVFIMEHIEPDPFIYIAIESTDYKRRASEDMGVGIASIIMNKIFNIKWETIAQIPRNKKLSKYTPDFISHSANGDTYIYECKGTTQPNKIEEIMSKGMGQVKSYPILGAKKYCFVTYLSSGKKAIPSFSFIADPLQESTKLARIAEANSGLFHQLKILDYLGLVKTKDLLQQQMVEEISRIYKKDSEEEIINISKIIEALTREISNYQVIEIHKTKYLGKKYHGEKRDLYLGIDINLVKDFYYNRNQEGYGNSILSETTSIFSDGTIFQLT